MLSIRNLSHVYPRGVRALNSLDLDVPVGMFGLLGPNGAGKSTLMRSIATLQTPTDGTIRFGDIDVISEPERLRRVLGYLPQDFGVYPRVSAYDMLEHMAVLKGVTSRSERRETVNRAVLPTDDLRLTTIKGSIVDVCSDTERNRIHVYILRSRYTQFA
jgi:ABC-type multidrug transport system ATPase subunit